MLHVDVREVAKLRNYVGVRGYLDAPDTLPNVERVFYTHWIGVWAGIVAGHG
jgi:hypothetical protein